MPVHISRRIGRVWYARGTVRVGKEKVVVAEFSTGCRARVDAEAAASAVDREHRAALASGRSVNARLTIADKLLAYLQRPGGVQPYDQARVADFNERIGSRLVADAPQAWRDWLAERGARMAPATARRWRAILVAALGRDAPALDGVHEPKNERMAYLTHEETERLLTAYSARTRPIAITLAYQGLRTQEALRLDWRCINWKRRTLYIAGGSGIGPVRTKSRKPRTIPMHRRVRVALYLLWRSQGRPRLGTVFIAPSGRPYPDTRKTGGNPLRSAHESACRTAKIEGFRVHDWRHHWAASMVMAGCDMPTLMRLGGWASLAMVQRYASVTTDHMAEAVRRLA